MSNTVIPFPAGPARYVVGPAICGLCGHLSRGLYQPGMASNRAHGYECPDCHRPALVPLKEALALVEREGWAADPESLT